MNKEQQELVDEVYENYKTVHKHAIRTEGNRNKLAMESLEKQLIYTQKDFINKIKTDEELSEKWGLKLEERELSLEERIELVNKSITATDGVNAALLWELSCQGKSKSKILNALNNSPRNIPTKLITLTYNDKTIESYE
jgi:ADP-ribosylglycohydrolase